MEYTREELIAICKKAVVPLDKWSDRDSPRSQERAGVALAMLSAGCPFKVLTEPAHKGDGCVTDENTVWIEVRWPTFMTFEIGNASDEGEGEWPAETFYLPTRKRLKDRKGQDWY